jgi:hypothetical protein
MSNRSILIFIIAAALALPLLSQAGSTMVAPSFVPGFPMPAGENVMILWVPIPGAVKYRIYLNGEPIGEATAPPFKYPYPSEPCVLKFTITGVDKEGNEGPKSKEGKISIIRLVQPCCFTESFKDERLRLRWEVVPNALIYDIYRADSKDGPYRLIASITETKYVDSEIKKSEKVDQTFYYKIVSKDKFNRSSTDDESHEVKIQKEAGPPPIPSPSLKIMRSKEVTFVKPDILSCFDAAFLSDKKSLVLVDTFSQKIIVIDSTGKTIRTIGEAGIRPDQYKEPIRIAVDENDSVYVLDAKKPRIFAYDSKGALIYSKKVHTIDEAEIINHYSDSMWIKEPLVPKLNAIVVHDDHLYAADNMTGVIQIYDKYDGSFVDYYKNKKDDKIVYFASINKILISDDDKLYLGGSLLRKVMVVDINTGELLLEIGTSKTYVGSFASVNGMAFDKNGDLVVSDGVFHTVQLFSKDKGLYKDSNSGYIYHIGGEKAAPDPASKDKRPEVNKEQRPNVNLDFAGPVNFDADGRLWVYLGRDKGFSVREYIKDNIWDAEIDKPEL